MVEAAVSYGRLFLCAAIILHGHRRYHLWCYQWTPQHWIHNRWERKQQTCRLHALQGEWPIHYGGPCLQLYVHPGRFGLHCPGSGEQATHASPQSHSAAVCGFRCCPCCLFHVQGLYAHQTAWILARLLAAISWEAGCTTSNEWLVCCCCVRCFIHYFLKLCLWDE